MVGLANRGIASHSVGRARNAGLVLSAFCTLDFPLADVQVFHTGRDGEFDDTRIDELLDVFDIKRSLPRKGNPLRQHRGRVDEQAAEKGARVPEPLRHDRAAEARPQRLRVVVRRPAAPLHPRIPEPEGIHRTRTRPLRNCPTRCCQSSPVSPRRRRPTDTGSPGSSASTRRRDAPASASR